MQYTNEQIKDIILEYVMDTRYKQAILIDGEWGSGKTYFVEKTLIPALKSQVAIESHVVYVSSYGIETVKQLSDEIYTSVMAMLIAKKTGSDASTTSKVATIFSKIVMSGLGHCFDTSSLPQYSDFSSLKNVILILDDLERCRLHINSLLGFLNNLVEHNDIKIIIVANQNEIGKIGLTDDLAQKYSVVLHDNYEPESLQDDSPTTKHSTEKQKKITSDSLQKYAYKLFSNDVLYDKLKEKLIGFTIKYQPNFSACFDAIVEENIKLEPATRSFICENKNLIIERFEKENHYNLRTLIFSLIIFERIHRPISDLALEAKYLKDISQSILIYIINVSIYIKDGGQLSKWKDKMLWYTISRQQMFSNYDAVYRYVDDYLKYRIIDDDKLVVTVSNLVEEQVKNDKDSEERNKWKCNNLYQWWLLEDEDREKTLEGIYQELSQNLYPYYYYKDIVVSFAQMENHGIEFDVGKYINTMVKNISSEIQGINKDRFRVLGKDAFARRITDLLAPIIEELNQHEKTSLKTGINCYEPLEVWGENFKTFCEDNKILINNEKSFFSAIDINELYSALINSNVCNVYGFIDGVSSIYHFDNLYDFFPDDLEPVKKLIERLKEYECTSISKQIALKKLIDILIKSSANLTFISA